MKNLAKQNSDGRASWEETGRANALRRKCKWKEMQIKEQEKKDVG